MCFSFLVGNSTGPQEVTPSKVYTVGISGPHCNNDNAHNKNNESLIIAGEANQDDICFRKSGWFSKYSSQEVSNWVLGDLRSQEEA